MRLVRFSTRPAQISPDIRAALTSLGRGDDRVGGVGLVGVQPPGTDTPVDAVIITGHGVVVVVGVDLPDPAIRLEAPLRGVWKADDWPLTRSDDDSGSDAGNPSAEALAVSDRVAERVRTAVGSPGTAVGTIIAVGPFVEHVEQPADELSGPVRIVYPTSTSLLASIVSLSFAPQPLTVEQARAVVAALSPDTEFDDDTLAGEGFAPTTSAATTPPATASPATASPAAAWPAAASPATAWPGAAGVAGVAGVAAPATGGQGDHGQDGSAGTLAPAPSPAPRSGTTPTPDARPDAPGSPGSPADDSDPLTDDADTEALDNPPHPDSSGTGTAASTTAASTTTASTTAAPTTTATPPDTAPSGASASGASASGSPAPGTTTVEATSGSAPTPLDTAPNAPGPNAPGPNAPTSNPTTSNPTTPSSATPSSAAPTPSTTAPSPSTTAPTATGGGAPATASTTAAPTAASAPATVPPTQPATPGRAAPAPPADAQQAAGRQAAAAPGTQPGARTAGSAPFPMAAPPTGHPPQAGMQAQPSGPPAATQSAATQSAATQTGTTRPGANRGSRAAPAAGAPAGGAPMRVGAARQPWWRRLSARTWRWITAGAVFVVALVVIITFSVMGGGDEEHQPIRMRAGGLEFTQRAAQLTEECAAHAVGDLSVALADGGCTELRRGSFDTTVGGTDVAVSVAALTFPDEQAAQRFLQVADTPGTGTIRDLATASGRWTPPAPDWSGAAYVSDLEGSTVRLVLASPRDRASDDSSEVAEAAEAALGLVKLND
ncbi:hypothetical protein FB384_000169 [Prauserella sediminis]|uniref:Uncharacterized protein n=1 Tax=Prauserella sediminis TaxID=577680 RepID=A0A839XMW4_9PSEU|nr:hypothetical protein [Prauserella sediminis]MBB3661265.1 hypothetical protein [Prauserella sediminis]